MPTVTPQGKELTTGLDNGHTGLHKLLPWVLGNTPMWPCKWRVINFSATIHDCIALHCTQNGKNRVKVKNSVRFKTPYRYKPTATKKKIGSFFFTAKKDLYGTWLLPIGGNQ